MESELIQLNSSVKALDEKLTKLGTNSEEGIQELNRTLESRMSLGNVMNTVNASLKTVEKHIIKIEEMIEREMKKKKDSQIEQPSSISDQCIENYSDQPKPIIIDTCAMPDGRIVEMLESGIWEGLEGTVIITDLLKGELINITNEKDRLQGHENLKRLRKNIKNSISDEDIIETYDDKAVNEKLSQLISDTEEETLRDIDENDKKFYLYTSDTNGILVTVDFALAKLCHDTNVSVMHLGELYATIKPKMLFKGEHVYVYLEKSGTKPNQATGYTEHGQKVVVEKAEELIDTKQTVRITGSTSSDCLFFAELIESDEGGASHH